MASFVINYLGHVVYYCPSCDHVHGIPIKGYCKEEVIKWNFSEKDGKPTISPSVKISTQEKTVCHHFVKDGKIQYCGDTPTKFANKIVDLINYTEYIEKYYKDWPEENKKYYIGT